MESVVCLRSVCFVFYFSLPSCPESEPKLSMVSALATSASFWTLESCRRQKARPHNSPATPEHTQHEHNYHSGFGIFFIFFFHFVFVFCLGFLYCLWIFFCFVFQKRRQKKIDIQLSTFVLMAEITGWQEIKLKRKKKINTHTHTHATTHMETSQSRRQDVKFKKRERERESE